MELSWWRIGSTDFAILKGYELWMDDGLGGKFSRAYDGYNKPFETYFVATGLVPGRVYRSYVRGINLVGAGPDSDVLYRAMAVEPSAPSELKAVTAGADTVLCSWKPATPGQRRRTGAALRLGVCAGAALQHVAGGWTLSRQHAVHQAGLQPESRHGVPRPQALLELNV